MTLGKLMKFYQAYKDDFDLEMTMKNNKLRYCDLNKEETLDDAIPL